MSKFSTIRNPSKEQARKKARWIISLNQGSAALEGRAVNQKTLKRAEDRIVTKILAGELKIDSEGIE